MDQCSQIRASQVTDAKYRGDRPAKEHHGIQSWYVSAVMSPLAGQIPASGPHLDFNAQMRQARVPMRWRSTSGEPVKLFTDQTRLHMFPAKPASGLLPDPTYFE